MPAKNKTIIASAGSGKTTFIVQKALEQPNAKQLITTFTLNNVDEIKKKFFEVCGTIPENITVTPWFSFLLHDLVRPYQADFFDDYRVDTLSWADGHSDIYAPKANPKRYFFGMNGAIYSDKISEFACCCNKSSAGMVIDRLERLYENIFIDEIQDLAGRDIEVLELIFKSKIEVLVTGDIRQATYTTHTPRALKKYSGKHIIDKFKEWEKIGLCNIEFMAVSHRCHPLICEFSDQFFPKLPNTASLNRKNTDHDGIFIISKDSVPAYLMKYKETKILKYNKTEKCMGYKSYNFGDAKGLTFERTLIFPHGPIKKLIEKWRFHCPTDKGIALRCIY